MTRFSEELSIDDKVVAVTRKPVLDLVEDPVEKQVSEAVSFDIYEDAIIEILDPIWLTVNPIMKEIRP